MNKIIFVLATISLATGLISAYYWHQASKVKVSPAWEPEIRGDRERNVMAWVTGNMVAFTESGNLNKLAAWYAAIAVASGAISNFISFVGSSSC